VKYIALSILSVLILGCGPEKPEHISINDCLHEEDKEFCFFRLFHTDGPFAATTDYDEQMRLIRIENKEDLSIICEELFKDYENDHIEGNLFTILFMNSSPCICDYAAMKVYENEGDVNHYKKVLNRICDNGKIRQR